MNKSEVTLKITHAIIDHFRNKTDGPGYFYMDEEWAISKIVRKELDIAFPTFDLSEDEINIGDRVVLDSDDFYPMSAENGADGICTGRIYKRQGNEEVMMITVEWNRENPKCHNQLDGNYYVGRFKKAKNATN